MMLVNLVIVIQVNLVILVILVNVVILMILVTMTHCQDHILTEKHRHRRNVTCYQFFDYHDFHH